MTLLDETRNIFIFVDLPRALQIWRSGGHHCILCLWCLIILIDCDNSFRVYTIDRNRLIILGLLMDGAFYHTVNSIIELSLVILHESELFWLDWAASH